MLAWMFPGQGLQKPGLGRQLFADFEIAQETLELASEICDHDLAKLRVQGPQARLNEPQIAEPLIAATECAYVQILQNAGIYPTVVAGYSAGEVAAYFSAGVLSLKDALLAATIRGRVLQRFQEEDTRMIAVQKVKRNIVEQCIASRADVCVAGYNAEEHTTLVGEKHLIGQVIRELRTYRSEIADVEISGPWHTPRVQSAVSQIEQALADIEFMKPQCQVYNSATGCAETEPSRLAHNLAKQVAVPVQWQSIVQHWWRRNVRQVWEIGAGQVLTMLRRNWTDFRSYEALCLESSSGRAVALIRLLTQFQPTSSK